MPAAAAAAADDDAAARLLPASARPFASAAYVIMLAGANSISAAAVGLVYLCAVGPSLVCKVGRQPLARCRGALAIAARPRCWAAARATHADPSPAHGPLPFAS